MVLFVGVAILTTCTRVSIIFSTISVQFIVKPVGSLIVDHPVFTLEQIVIHAVDFTMPLLEDCAKPLKLTVAGW